MTEQAAKAGCRVTSTGDILGRDESPVCQGWFRCNQTCHNVQQWPGWCTRGLFSPKWLCDLSFVPNSVCDTACVSLCTRFLMFPYTSAARISRDRYCQLDWTLSLSLFLARLPPLDLFLLHFHIYFLFADPVFLCDHLALFVFISHRFLCAFMLKYLCLSRCTHPALHAPCTFLFLSVLQQELQIEKGRQEEDFSFRNQNCWKSPNLGLKAL